jgi:hypothetical protein
MSRCGLDRREEQLGLDKADRLNRDFAKAGNPLGQDTRISDFDRLDTYNKILTAPTVKFKDLKLSSPAGSPTMFFRSTIEPMYSG